MAVIALRALGLGDLLTVVPALRALRRGLPDHRVTLAVPRSLATLARMTGAVDHVLHASGLRPLRSCGRVDIAVNLHGRGPQSHEVLRRCRPAELLAFAHPAFPAHMGPAWDPGEHEVDRWCRLVAWYGFAPDPGDLDLPAPACESPAPGAVVVHPGAGSPARRWPCERYAAVAAAIHAEGHKVVVTGGSGETAQARQVVALAGLGPAADLSGRTPPPRVAALVAGARLVICGDTGMGHLATAYRTASVLLFGPTPPALWGPPRRPEHTVLWTGGDGDPHGRAPDPGLLQIPAGQVIAAALRSLRATTA
ncbi:MAG: ADP-heptose:LPS heptosyltransferase [Streptosporangiaceae bacterium]|nr:ADP-heptose:LPS heptosyltransferase [Streptosporangiaceae bacterium]